MAEQQTFTVDTTPQTETLTDNLTADEQDSLAVGEKLVAEQEGLLAGKYKDCLLYTSPSPRDRQKSRMPSSA